MTNILTIISDYIYDSHMYSILKEAEEKTDKTIYVCLNKTYKSIINDLKESNLDPSKFVIVDVVTSSLIKPPEVPNCVFLPEPKHIDKLYSGIIHAVKTHQTDLLVFDSLSSLHTHHDCDTIFEVLKEILAALALLDCSTVFTVLKCDASDTQINHIKMLFDKIIEVD